MKRYLSGIIAVVIAVGAFAFTGENKVDANFASHDFFYLPPAPNDYSQTSVQDKGNWKSTEDLDCDGAPNKACRIAVNDDYTRDSSGIRVFNMSGLIANISATAGAAGASTGYVPVTSSPSVGLTAKTDRP